MASGFEYDLMVEKGMVIDGTGRPAFVADLAIAGDRIAAIGNLASHKARKVIAAAGLTVAPGFIDIHSHSDYMLLMDPEYDSNLLQGITTEVSGNCGFSPVPLGEKTWLVDWWVDHVYNVSMIPREEAEGIFQDYGFSADWKSSEGFMKRLEEKVLGVNYCQLMGLYSLRAAVMDEVGAQPWRQPTPQELEKMNRLLEAGMKDGLFGFSIGFHHTDPEMDVTGEELVALTKTVQQFNGLFAVHMRDYADRILDALEETMSIVDQTKVRTTISHLNVFEPQNWRTGKSRAAIDILEEAYQRGIEVYADVMVFTHLRDYMPSELKYFMPDYIYENGEAHIAEYVSQSDVMTRIEEDLRKGFKNRVFKKSLNIMNAYRCWPDILEVVHCPITRECEGGTISQLVEMRKQDPYRLVVDLFVQNKGKVILKDHLFSESDIKEVLAWNRTMPGSDGASVKALSRSERVINPRVYCTMHKFFGDFIRDQRLMSLEEAVRRVTSLPARCLRLKDRGILRVGAKADITIFNADTIRGFPDYVKKPSSQNYGTGIEYVLVNGKIAVEDGTLTGTRAGEVLRH